MEFDLKLQQFVDWKVYNVTPIKNKFGYRVVLIYADGTKIPQQKSGFATKKAANTDRDKTLGELYSGTYVVYTSVKVKDCKKPNTTAGDFPAKTFTKQEIGLKTPSSYRTIPIPDYVFEAILEERKVYEKNSRRRSGTFQDLDYICCSTYGRPRSKDFHWRHYKKLLEDNGLPDIRWHDLRSTFCTILLKNNFNPKAVSQLMGHAKEIITIDVYGDTAEIIEDCLDDLQPFIDEVIPKEESESGTDFSEDNYIEQISEFLA